MKALRRISNFEEFAILAKALASGWPFRREILNGAQMSACYQYGYPEVFHVYCWRWLFHLC